MQSAKLLAVKEFMTKRRLETGLSLLDAHKPEVSKLLLTSGTKLIHWSKSILATYELTKDERCLRLSLIIEELGELMVALADQNEVGALDALADLLYVVYGTAVSFDLPIDEAFYEVHRSNMTKQPATPDNPRLRDKGPNYSPADLKSVLERYRCSQAKSKQ